MKINPKHINQFLKSEKNANWAGVFYSPPFKNDFQFLLQDLNLMQIDSMHRFIFHPFDNSTIPRVVLHPHYQNEEAINKVESYESNESTFWEMPVLKSIESTLKVDYAHQFKKYILAINEGKCTKAILSTVIKTPILPTYNWGEYLLMLRKQYPQAFIYLFSSPITGTWIGATPEVFLNWDKNEIATMSLAGTKKQLDNHIPFGNKEKTEQAIVTSYICEVFRAYFGNVKCIEPVEFSYGEITHLITKISSLLPVKFNKFNFLQLAENFHPTPAVGGYPKQVAIDLINETEQHPRLYYSGYFGVITNNSAELAVNLRCMNIGADSVVLYAGGGITKDSVLEAEWNETRLKAEALLKFL